MSRLVALMLCSMTLAGAASAAKPRAPTEAPTTHVSCTGGPREIKIIVRNVKKSEGLITADLYRNEQTTFLRGPGRLQQVRFAAKSPVTMFCLTAPSDEAHAVAVYQDKNANKKFDKGAFGLPVEPYGVSNNPRMRFGPPHVEEALFDIAAEGTTVEIMLNN